MVARQQLFKNIIYVETFSDFYTWSVRERRILAPAFGLIPVLICKRKW